MKRIYSAADLQEAHLLAQLLQEHNIDCHVFNENLQGGVGEIPFVQAYPEIWLGREEDESRARGSSRISSNGQRMVPPGCAAIAARRIRGSS